MKIVINKCHGGFSVNNDYLSYIQEKYSNIECFNLISRDDIDIELYESIYNEKLPKDLEFKTGKRYMFDNDRSNPMLVDAVENVKSNIPYGFGNTSMLEVIEIPDDSYWVILEFDGYEQLIYSNSPILSDTEFKYEIKGVPNK